MTTEPKEILALHWRDVRAWGCPNCGYDGVSSSLSVGSATSGVCTECDTQFIILGDGLTKSPMGFGLHREAVAYPTLSEHPRVGIPAHERPHRHPEFFRSRGVGMDDCPGCFVCGGASGMMDNISGLVHTKAAGENVVAMFERGAYLDFRASEKYYIQVKIGACKEHLPNLKALDNLTRLAHNMISKKLVQRASKADLIRSYVTLMCAVVFELKRDFKKSS